MAKNEIWMAPSFWSLSPGNRGGSDQSVIDKTWDERIMETKFERGKFENFLRIVIRSWKKRSFIEYSSTDLNSKRRIFHENQCCNGVEHATIGSRFQTGSNGLQHICVTMSCTQRSVNKLLQTHSRRIYISRSVTQYSWRNTINNSRMRIDLSINLFERNQHRL